MRQFLTSALLAAAALVAVATLRADEGMWTFDNFPAAQVKAKYGVTIDEAWLKRVQLSAVRLPSGCSASVVSAGGLVLTNHHCVRDCVQSLSTSQVNFVENGFSAGNAADERRCGGLQAEILTTIGDVTMRVAQASATKTGRDFVTARDTAIAAIEKEGCAGREATERCQVVSLYQGGQYRLYTYRTYADVRLVFAPEEQMAFFGGDPDNFNFPRYDLDCAFLRLYENGRPVSTPTHLQWSSAVPQPGTPVFVAGNPGTTQRLLTADQLEVLRDSIMPETLYWMAELRGRLARFSEESAEHRRIAEDLLFGIENGFKAYRGQELALSSPGFVDGKRRDDQALRLRAAATPAGDATGDPWSDIARVQTDRRALTPAYTYMERRAGYGSDLFGYARTLVRSADERAKPNGERLPEYTDSRLALLERQLLNTAPVYPELEELTLSFWLSKLRENLTVDDAGTKSFLGKDSPEMIGARLATSKLGDPALRKALWDGGSAAIRSSGDPLIQYVLATDAASRHMRQEYEARVTGPSDRAAARIAQARFAAYGTNAYPDATFTPRLSYGQIQGWTANGRAVEPFTRFSGLWERATGQFPYQLASKWEAARGRVNDTTVFNMVTDNDIIGGNSGSPVIDAQARVVGVIFDGNIESLGGAFAFDARVNRAVSVATAAISEALDKVYGQQALLRELTGN
ncbi:MAG: S46 family peptidase [Vicinamibacterales bacterium]